MPKHFIHIRAKRTVGLEQLTLREVTVLSDYHIEAETSEEALEEFYWSVPIEDHSHFNVEVV
ncbi:hypothetical protein NKH72_22040 [Mesorhizobium sp. M0955]|uniref:hypothetical protein n=1 Tax=Mesorhizobium sp. M0955 TaxID=2957033 RepID=UPI003338C142